MKKYVVSYFYHNKIHIDEPNKYLEYKLILSIVGKEEKKSNKNMY